MSTNNVEQKERITSQKKIILDYLKSVKTHPSAEIIYSAVKRKLPQISRGTVYRNLKNLKEKSEILEIPARVSRYDGDISVHGHFFCQECGKILDVFDPPKFFFRKKLWRIKV